MIYIHEYLAFGCPHLVLSLIETKLDSRGFGIDAYEQAEQLYAQLLGWA